MSTPQSSEKVTLTDGEKDRVERANFGEPNCELEDVIEQIIADREAALVTALTALADDCEGCGHQITAYLDALVQHRLTAPKENDR